MICKINNKKANAKAKAFLLFKQQGSRGPHP